MNRLKAAAKRAVVAVCKVIGSNMGAGNRKRVKLLLQRISDIFWVARQPLGTTVEKPMGEIRHLPFSLRDAVSRVPLHVEMDEKLRKGFYSDKLVVIAAIPKSASSVFSSCVRELYPYKCKSDFASYMNANQDIDLRPELVLDFPQGGVLKYHPHATGKNIKVLDLLKVKYIVLLRHPADQLTAIYCHWLRILEDLYRHAIEKPEQVMGEAILYDPILPLSSEIFGKKVSKGETLHHLISDGYLYASLSWMTNWLRFRNKQRSCVVLYEDFVRDMEGTLNHVSTFLLGSKVREDVFERCRTIGKSFFARREDLVGKRPYRHGWTGKIGVWRDYFTEQNRDEYAREVKAFLGSYPGATLLLDHYPDLVDLRVKNHGGAIE